MLHNIDPRVEAREFNLLPIHIVSSWTVSKSQYSVYMQSTPLPPFSARVNGWAATPLVIFYMYYVYTLRVILRVYFTCMSPFWHALVLRVLRVLCSLFKLAFIGLGLIGSLHTFKQKIQLNNYDWSSFSWDGLRKSFKRCQTWDGLTNDIGQFWPYYG